ncbi:ABC transporter ATP-binding protein [Nocardioides sp. AE5]|uniref:ABC transporter ATP-binding protein n=1 Tax=Nocardioides sp. AE5 TaxID=2962573 RepID=UPI002881A36F|nr:ABC transporter ATP-binding protein [Nocardioides sp. AE5]MDT0201857.1 ABC transporter ATP-binding protein [Nocardioides sp. AE5]
MSKAYAESQAPVFQGLSLTLKNQEFLCIVGPSGCGKTTLLRCISGLIPATSGSIALNEKVLNGPIPSLAIVFQEYGRSLLPWFNVWDNVALPLRAKGLSRGEVEFRVRSSLEEVQLAGAAEKFPRQLSGGMQQRVSIARALAFQPSILLMDEPFASVDAQTREDLEDLILRVRAHHSMTILFITHDIDEAIYLGDRVMVLSQNPTTIRAEYEVQLPDQRDQIATKSMQRFSELRSRIRADLA